MRRIPCPKCKAAYSWFLMEGDAVVQKCVCGYHGYVRRVTKEGMVQFNKPEMEDPLKLPNPASGLGKCLWTVYKAQSIKTGDLAVLLEQSNSATASQLVSLEVRGLVERSETRKGKAGGSFWSLTSDALRLIGDTKCPL